jgi:hypothetical protein
MKRLTALVLILLQVMFVASTVAQSQRSVSVRGGPKFIVDVPMGYSFATETAQDGAVLVTMNNPVWQISVTAVVGQVSDPAVTSADWQRDFLIGRMAQALPDAKETDYNFKPLNPGPGQTGIVCVFTDAKYKTAEELPPNEFLHMTGGIRAWQGGAIHFTIMSNSIKSPEYREVYEMFRTGFVMQSGRSR